MLEFVEEDHLYVLDGIIIPSVSQILHVIFKDKYKDVPENILRAKAQYGTTIHEYIERYENNEELPSLDYIQQASFKQYLKIKEENRIEVLEQEQMIHYKDKYAGRFDMIAKVDNDIALCDIKTTAELDLEYLSWQLSLYAFAIGKKFDKLYAIWLPKKELGKLVEIKRKTEREILKMLEDYEEEIEDEEEEEEFINDYPEEEYDREQYYERTYGTSQD